MIINLKTKDGTREVKVQSVRYTDAKYESAPYKSPTLRKLSSFRSLPDSWSVMGEGERIRARTLHHASNIYLALKAKGFMSFEVQPGLAGEIYISATRLNTEVECIVGKDLLFEIFVTVDEELIENTTLDKEDIFKKIKELSFSWSEKSSGYSTQGTLVRKKVGTQEWPSGRLVMTAYPSSQSNASYQTAPRFVSTSKSTTAA